MKEMEPKETRETIAICWVSGFDVEFSDAEIISTSPETKVRIPGTNRVMTLGREVFPQSQASKLRRAISEQFKG